eukprot:8360150-Ditylum_brightwellii.AAC.1
MEEDLDFPAQLNVTADQLATNFREENNTSRLMIPRVNINNVQLQVTHEVITGDLQKHIACTGQ